MAAVEQLTDVEEVLADNAVENECINNPSCLCCPLYILIINILTRNYVIYNTKSTHSHGNEVLYVESV